MTTTIRYNSRNYTIDLSKPLDISLPVKEGASSVKAWGVPPAAIQPEISNNFIGQVAAGGSVNFNSISFHPHAHGTHTECYGHITEKVHSINTLLDRYFYYAQVITIAPEKYQEDFVISRKQLQYALRKRKREALVIRTLPNTRQKRFLDYSGTNPPYLLEEAAAYIADIGIQHLLIDLPSVDKEVDYGALLAHRAFWRMEGKIRRKASITELIYVPNTIPDGAYFLSLHLAPVENDATPSRPVLYALQE